VASSVIGADTWAAELTRAAAAIELGNAAVISGLAAEVQADTQSRAPRATGDYANSWQSQRNSTPGSTSVSIFTEAPQAARLEYGFHGRDSKGRVYDQAPRSHQRAAIDAVYPQIKPALLAMVDRALQG
jgi:hypothetical protein